MSDQEGVLDDARAPGPAAVGRGTFQFGPPVFGAAVAVLGVLGLLRGDFTVVWHPVSEGLPGRVVLAYLTAILFILAGLAIQWRRFRVVGGVALGVLFALLSLPWLTRVIGFPQMIGTWVGYGEQLALALGAAMIALLPGNPGARTVAMCRIAFGLLQLVFGLGHFLALRETAGMTPAWLPPDQTFWAIATGVAHFAGGLAFILGVWPRTVAAVLAAMFTGFALLVWLPAALADPASPVAPAGLVITLALTGAMLALYDLLGTRGAARFGGEVGQRDGVPSTG
jgi:uncharacterized membrane protein YphA (DoxX/SURF4 family)